MGEAKRKRSATQRLIAEFPDCCFCGGLRRTATREHMPPTSLFDNSHRPDGLVMPACEECNKGTSKADLAVALLSRWDYYSSAQEQLDHSKLANRIKKQAPELVAEWLNIDAAEKKEHGSTCSITEFRSRQTLVSRRSVRFPYANSIYLRTRLFSHCILRIFEEGFRMMEVSLRLGGLKRILPAAAFQSSFSISYRATARYRRVNGMNIKHLNTGTP
jgi:hypothetical protein